MRDLFKRFSKRKSKVDGRLSSLGLDPTNSQPAPLSEAQIFRKNGQQRKEEGKFGDAVVMYEAAVAIEPGNAGLRLSLCEARAMCDPPQLERALQDVEVVIQQAPSNGDAYRRKGDILERLQNFKAAETAFQTAIQLLTGRARLGTHESLARVRERISRDQNNLPLESDSITPAPSADDTSPPESDNTSPTESDNICPSDSDNTSPTESESDNAQCSEPTAIKSSNQFASINFSVPPGRHIWRFQPGPSTGLRPESSTASYGGKPSAADRPI
ncbi:hypothetical protein G7Z17_g1885 [Cylindrodendrum hubeiense]|uniref:Tetratricopeptide repeat protein n=1 Tax=Cylindrodendrum hubeiense TaxID=595255 RepID=A0A9P5HLW0_9HYPO|nr:hypothetical protein G7Z17_g1885 [Cylindrodendrum hubeiense]